MVKRRSWKRYAYLAFVLLVMITCWEGNRANGFAFAGEGMQAAQGGVIPEQSIRLRILANSDSPVDQWIKREVRDAIVARMNTWVTEPQSLEAARELINARLPELESLVKSVLEEHGFSYASSVELGKVPFPTKMYGNRLYPAGDYEAVRVILGAGEGQNWWCVLFPPLCFVDSEMIVKKNESTAYAAEADKTVTEGKLNKTLASAGNEGKAAERGQDGKQEAADAAGTELEDNGNSGQTEPEVRFFLWDLVKKIGALFA